VCERFARPAVPRDLSAVDLDPTFLREAGTPIARPSIIRRILNMRFRNLLGLLAIGGAVVYAQKKRGGDMSLAGIKNSLRGVFDNVKNQVSGALGNQSQQSSVGATTSRATNDLGTSSGLGSEDYASGSYSRGNSDGIDRKY
jgi:hypothetical protein